MAALAPNDPCKKTISNSSNIAEELDKTKECAAQHIDTSAAKAIISTQFPAVDKNDTIDSLTKANSQKTENVKIIENEKSAQSEALLKSLAQAKNALQKLSNIQKRDAISVYGSFDTQTKASSSTTTNTKESKETGINISLGKVFSTGVAAQNLSEAQIALANSNSIASCIKTLPEVLERIPAETPIADRTEFSNSYLKSCGEMAAKVFDDKKAK